MRQYEENRHDNYTCLYSKELGGSLTLSLSLWKDLLCEFEIHKKEGGPDQQNNLNLWNLRHRNRLYGYKFES